MVCATNVDPRDVRVWLASHFGSDDFEGADDEVVVALVFSSSAATPPDHV